MSKSKKRHVPAYRHHKARNLAKVRINGKDYYLGPYGSPESHDAYDELISKHFASPHLDASQITISEVLALFWRYAKKRYGQHGKGPYGNAVNWRPIIRMLRERHGSQRPLEFGPRAFRHLIDVMRNNDWSRVYAQENVARVKKIFKWGVSMECVDIEVYQRLATVEAPRRGDGFREAPPIEPVSDELVDATIPFMRENVADMVRFQRLTGCRPCEVISIKPGELDRSGDVWIYVPGHHKTEHHGKKRRIAVGPRAQDVIRKYLVRKEDSFCFPSRRARCYSTDSYRRAIWRACERRSQDLKTPIESWSPGQLRHTAGTEVREEFGAEHAQAVLGHSRLSTTEIYAKVSEEKAKQVAMELG